MRVCSIKVMHTKGSKQIRQMYRCISFRFVPFRSLSPPLDIYIFSNDILGGCIPYEAGFLWTKDRNARAEQKKSKKNRWGKGNNDLPE